MEIMGLTSKYGLQDEDFKLILTAAANATVHRVLGDNFQLKLSQEPAVKEEENFMAPILGLHKPYHVKMKRGSNFVILNTIDNIMIGLKEAEIERDPAAVKTIRCTTEPFVIDVEEMEARYDNKPKDIHKVIAMEKPERGRKTSKSLSVEFNISPKTSEG